MLSPLRGTSSYYVTRIIIAILLLRIQQYTINVLLSVRIQYTVNLIGFKLNIIEYVD